MRAALIGALAIVALACAPLAAATTGVDVRSLVAKAVSGDQAALTELRAVETIDGRTVDLGRALRGVEGAELAERLRIIEETGGAEVTAGNPRETSAEILKERRFRGSSVPRPLHGALGWLGKRLRTLATPFRWLADRVPGGVRVGYVLVGTMVVVAAAVVAVAIARRRAGADLARSRRFSSAPDDDPDLLERAAESAERDGELERALRLRFRAGLARLGRAGAIPPGEWTSGELRPIVEHRVFDHLAADFDAIVYGGRPPTGEDVARSRVGWPEVVEGARRPS